MTSWLALDERVNDDGFLEPIDEEDSDFDDLDDDDELDEDEDDELD